VFSHNVSTAADVLKLFALNDTMGDSGKPLPHEVKPESSRAALPPKFNAET
jgi:hypothetical protein